jgi:tRNA A37 threonylcarbamoyladenosine modification protein TsaB
MKISIGIKARKVTICLFDNKKLVDKHDFFEKNNLSEKLLPAIDRLLRKNRLEPREIKMVSIQSDTPESFTTTRIAQTVGKTWNFGAKIG